MRPTSFDMGDWGRSEGAFSALRYVGLEANWQRVCVARAPLGVRARKTSVGHAPSSDPSSIRDNPAARMAFDLFRIWPFSDLF